MSDVTCTVHAVRQQGAEPREFAVPVKDVALEGGFVASSVLREVEGGQRTDIVVRDTTGTEREIVLTLRVVAGGDLDHVFVTDGKGPVKLTDTGHTRYRSFCSLPVVTFFGPGTGWTSAAPLEVPAPSLTFSWRRGRRGLLTVTATVANLRLSAKGEARAGLLVARHDGCWRPGLGWLVSLYPEFFRPPNPKVFECDGPMIYDFVTPEARLRRDIEQDLKWQELGWYWPHLGLYLPASESWSRQPRSEGGIGQGGTVTRQMLNDYIALSNRLGSPSACTSRAPSHGRTMRKRPSPNAATGARTAALPLRGSSAWS